jgi:hypothetical protein
LLPHRIGFMKRSLGSLKIKGIKVCSEISLKIVHYDIKLRENGTAIPLSDCSGTGSFLHAMFMD